MTPSVVCYEDNCEYNDDTECLSDEVQISASITGEMKPYCASFELIDDEDETGE